MSAIGYINVSLETFGGLMSLIFMVCLRITRPHRGQMERLYTRLLICNTVLLFSDAAAWLFKGRPDAFSFYAVRITNFLVFALGYVMLVLFTHYLICFLKRLEVNVSKTPLYLMAGLVALAVVLAFLSQFNHMYYKIDEQNVYHRQNLFWLSQVFGIGGMVLNSSLLIRFRKQLRKKDILAFGTYIFLPVAALLFQILFYNIAVLYLATTICLLCIYFGIQFDLSIEIAEKELELEKSRTAIMLSQIQPHFLYNTLLGIQELCVTEPQKAYDGLAYFSHYLRGNLDSLSETRLILFEKELNHVQNYLYLEKMRFEERLQVQWEIEYKNFLLPALSLQPIVENAVRYGITKMEGGGTLRIRSEQRGNMVVITVQDNGIGFDAQQPKSDGKTHTGIRNVANRLGSLCGGSLQIKSEPGAGTTATITLPQSKEYES